MSRADKTQTQITYDLMLDATNQTIQEIRFTVLCAARPVGAGVAPAPNAGAFTTQEHVAFVSTYRFTGQGADVVRFEIPADAQKLLR